ncbi:MAG: hypothetical protein ABIS45_10070 [Burkholderiales bacterium]
MRVHSGRRRTRLEPAKNVEIVVGVSPGGGVDCTARTLQKVLQSGA